MPTKGADEDRPIDTPLKKPSSGCGRKAATIIVAVIIVALLVACDSGEMAKNTWNEAMFCLPISFVPILWALLVKGA